VLVPLGQNLEHAFSLVRVLGWLSGCHPRSGPGHLARQFVAAMLAFQVGAAVVYASVVVGEGPSHECWEAAPVKSVEAWADCAGFEPVAGLVWPLRDVG
jgi:hypothetical protein